MSENRSQNEVFAPTTHAPVAEKSTASDNVKVEYGVDTPVETVPLPSNGLVYPPDSALHKQTNVEIRAMTTREEDILTSAALLKKGTVISELIKGCLVNHAINPTEMLMGDRNALMVAIRITGYGASYDAEVVCSECDVKTPREFNLAELPIKRLTIEPVTEGQNLFEFKLPRSKRLVRFKFLTGADEQDLQIEAERNKKLGMKSDNQITSQLLHSIVSIEGLSNRTEVASYIRRMAAADSYALRKYMRKNEPGIQMRQEVTCQQCGAMEVVAMPIGVSFLWPGADE